MLGEIDQGRFQEESMASQQPERKNDGAVGDGESSTGGGSPDRVLPLDALMHQMSECEDQDLAECARETVNMCITEATVRLAFEAGNNAVAQGKRKVISAEDLTRAIEGLKDKDTSPGVVLLEMDECVKAEKRAASRRRRQERKARLEQEAQQKAKEEEAAAAKEEEAAPAREEVAAAAREEEAAAAKEDGATGAGLQK